MRVRVSVRENRASAKLDVNREQWKMEGNVTGDRRNAMPGQRGALETRPSYPVELNIGTLKI